VTLPVAPLPAALVEPYLAALGVEPRRPDDALLADVAARHLARVPFESFTKLRLYAERAAGPARHPDDARFLRDLAALGAGDTCFGIAHALGGLLAALGFRVHFVGARVGDAAPDAGDNHVACVATWRDHPMLVDCGFATPLPEPVPLERDVAAREIVVPYARHRYVPASGDRFTLEQWDAAHSTWVARYHLLARPCPFEAFHPSIDRSFALGRDSYFLQRLYAVKNEPTRKVALLSDRLCVTTAAGLEETKLDSLRALVSAAETHLGIARDHGDAAARVLSETLGIDPFDPDRAAPR
jgi:arylamine N-acetyltransferase